MLRSTATLAAALLALPALAQQPPSPPPAAAPCVTCHGSNGIAMLAMYPNLAGQNAPYLKAALNAYREGRRTGGTAGLMIPMARSLSDEDIDALAAYFSALPADGKGD